MTYSTRVKAFPLDGALAVLLIGAAFALIARPTDVRRWIGVTGLAIVGSIISAAALGIAAAGLGAGALAALRRGKLHRALVVCVVLFGVFTVLWWWLVLREAVNDELRHFWAPFYISLGRGLGKTIRDLRDGVGGLAVGFVRVSAWVSVPVFAYGAIVFLRASWERALVLLLPFSAAIALAALRAAPFGGGRTDIYLYPALALLAGVGIHDLARRTRRLAAPATIAILVGLIILGSGRVEPYPIEDIRPLVARLESQKSSGDGVLVYHYASFAYALYSAVPVEIFPSQIATMGFYLSFPVRDVRVLPYRPEAPRTYARLLDAMSEQHQRLWMPATRRLQDFDDIERMLGRRGFRREATHRRPGATLTLWSKGEL
jgi:hypothetical protein